MSPRNFGMKTWNRWLCRGLRQCLDSPVLILIGLLGAALNLSCGTAALSADGDQGLLSRFARQLHSPGECRYPCKCANNQPQCRAGVSMRRDGCDCCYICTRQQGDICDARFICDEAKRLYCDFEPDDGPTGICRATSALVCEVGNVIYKDGEAFNLNCSTTCTCQNGHYACASLCPWEERPPSSLHCDRPELVTISKRCCREWVCMDDHQVAEAVPINPPVVSVKVPQTRPCTTDTTKWSACSQTCDMGTSMRLSSNNKDCQNVLERRLCFIRPCDHNNTYTDSCKSTIKVRRPIRIRYGNCESTEYYKPKYCSTCKKRKCCGPGRTKTRQIEFSCPDDKVFSDSFMWIRNCVCIEVSPLSRRCPFT